jgi:hypothetical protein
MSQTLSPTTDDASIATPSFSAAARKRSGSGFANRTRSRVMTTVVARSTPRFSRTGRAVSMRPLVAIAHGIAALVSVASNAFAPGRGRTSGAYFMYACA